MATPRWNGRAVFGPGLLCYLGPGHAAAEHAHHAVQFVLSPDPFQLHLPGGTVTTRAALVPADVPHALEVGGTQMALFLVENHGSRGRELHRLAQHWLGADLHQHLDSPHLPASDAAATDVLRWAEGLLSTWGTLASPETPLSPAIRQVLAQLAQSSGPGPRLAEAAAGCGLSASRLTHRFSAETGIPYRRYLLWLRLQRAVDSARSGATLTEAAVEAGFSDSAHLSRTFRAMLGLNPAAVLPLRDVWGRAHGLVFDEFDDRSRPQRSRQDGRTANSVQL